MENINFWFFIISFSLLFIFTLLFGILGKTKQMYAAIIACAIGMAFSQLDKIDFFKIVGFEAKMKKYVEETTIKNMQKMSISIAECVMDLIIADGRAGGGLRWSEQKKMFDNLIERLKELGLNQEQITQIKERSLWNKLLLMDHIHMMLNKNFLNKIPGGQYGEIRDRIYKNLFNHKTYIAADGNEFRKLFKEYNLLTPEVEESIKDLEFFQAHKEFRRPQVWNEYMDRIQ